MASPMSGHIPCSTRVHIREQGECCTVESLHRFFANGCPYTYTADIVIAVNPYRWFDNLFTDERRQLYSVADRTGNSKWCGFAKVMVNDK
eukprot:2405125-Amphidinium_carterae.1